MKNFVIVFALLVASVFSQNNELITKEKFDAAILASGFKIASEETFQLYRAACIIWSGIFINEYDMFLAQLLHESAGFQFTEELECLKGDKCEGRYVDEVGLPGKKYYGRGYIQLTWAANYKAASQALGLGDLLLEQPELVASNKSIAMLTSAWFWVTNVHPKLGKTKKFGLTTKAINSGECKYPKYHWIAKKRWQIYLNVAEAFEITDKAVEIGCYN